MSKAVSNLGVTIPELECTCWVNLINDSVRHPWTNVYGIRMYGEDCLNGTFTWQYYNNNVFAALINWENMDVTEPGFYNISDYDPFIPGARGPGIYRVKVSIPNCGNFFSNIHEVFVP